MEMAKYEVRVLLRHYWKQNYKVAAEKKRRSGGLNGLRVAI
jgi:hypothetical protein